MASSRAAKSPRRTADENAPAESGRLYGGLSASERRAGRRARLLAAGFDLFGTIGFQKTTIPMICSASGVTARHFYEEFPSREALLRAIYDDVSETTYQIIRDALRETDKPHYERVLASNQAYYEYLTADPRRARIYALESLGVSPELEQHRRVVRERVVQQLTRATDWLEPTGVLRNVDSRLVAVGLSSAAVAILAEWVLAARKPSVEKMAETLTMFWVRTLQMDTLDDAFAEHHP
ncbi:MAG TPA: TetR/AcrR family transcriptional regulator [Candidatus Sulfotelmatobacter sp.]|nr:TetR/AcrR family transcriptional regulator [Candidatus Sulfotelmatobacter sp.]